MSAISNAPGNIFRVLLSALFVLQSIQFPHQAQAAAVVAFKTCSVTSTGAYIIDGKYRDAFSANIVYDSVTKATTGSLKLNAITAQGTRLAVQTTLLSSFILTADKTATFQGQCTVNGAAGYSFSASLQDVASPGVNNDKFSIAITGSGLNFSLLNKVLSGGDIGITYVALPPVSQIPPDPATVAPPLDRTVATTVADSTKFLYTGNNPIQNGVNPDIIEPVRTAVVRGKVLQDGGTPLSGVKITIQGHPEFGQTLTRADGMFDLVVNGGGYLSVNYTKQGFLPAQRQVNVPWNDSVVIDDIMMVPMDTNVTPINLTLAAPSQVARGSAVTDERGTRQATLIFNPGTQITSGMSLMTSANVRATEFTVGPDGMKKMPALLPPTTMYTYAVDFSIDEAVAAGVDNIQFSQPVYAYVENFLNYPVGGLVPSGYYDRSRSTWIPSENGRIIKILSVANGKANVDVDGNGNPADSSALAGLGFSTAELQKLASLYAPGTSLWRVPINHFTIWDFNWPWAPPIDAVFPPDVPPNTNNPLDNCPAGNCSPTATESGSIIEAQNQILGETIPVKGTSYTLNYRSDRVPGYVRKIDVLVTDDRDLPASLIKMKVKVTVAGREIASETILPDSSAPSPTTGFQNRFPKNHFLHAIWDGRDSYGRLVQGTFNAHVRVEYYWPMEAAIAGRQFSAPGNGDPIHPPGMGIYVAEYPFFTEWDIPVNVWHSLPMGLGGWSLDIHHAYDPAGHGLYMGDGRRRTQVNNISLLTRSLGNNSGPFFINSKLTPESAFWNITGVAIAPDGSLYFAAGYEGEAPGGQTIYKMTKDKNISVFKHVHDGPLRLAFGPDGSLYYATQAHVETSNGGMIRRIWPDGTDTLVGGGVGGNFVGGQWGGSYTDNHGIPLGEGGLATETPVNPYSIAVGPDGAVYFTHHESSLRRIGPDGIITTIVYNHEGGPIRGDGGPASQAVAYPEAVALGPDGTIFFSDYYTINYKGINIRQITPDGMIKTLAYIEDGGGFWGLAFSSGTLYAAGWLASGGYVIYAIYPSGQVIKVAGSGIGVPSLNNAGSMTNLGFPYQLAMSPDGSLFVAVTGSGWNGTYSFVRQLSLGLGMNILNDFFVPSDDGKEVYHFNSDGRHLETLDAITKAVIYKFAYNANGQLISVTDGNGNVTTIERNSAGNMTGIVGPYGQRTAVTLDANGYLASVTDPAGASFAMTSDANGLLKTFRDPKGNVHTMYYNVSGRLVKDTNPSGTFTSLSRQDQDGANSFTVSLSKGLGSATSFSKAFKVAFARDGSITETNTFADSSIQMKSFAKTGEISVHEPDGTRTDTVQNPDQRFGMGAPLYSQTITMPSGLVATSTENRAATWGDNLLDLTTQMDTFTLNGKTYTRAYTASNKTVVTTSPVGRQSMQIVDDQNRVRQHSVPGLNTAYIDYDSRGRLSAITQGAGADYRSFTLAYNSSEYPSSLTDPLGRTMQFFYDNVGRITSYTLPGNRTVGLTYDANGNVTSVTPPGRPAHSFNYTPVDLTGSYTAPDIGAGPSQTTYAYDNAEHKLTRITRPDGQTVNLEYNFANRLSKITIPTGQYLYSYAPKLPTPGGAASPHLMGITAPGNEILAFTYDGSLLTSVQWTGPVAGSVAYTYNNDFRVTSQSINGANIVNFVYDNDGLLTQAGDLVLTRDTQNGLLTATSQGAVADTRTYNGFAELASYSANFSSGTYQETISARDKLGRITAKSEIIGGITTNYQYTYDSADRLGQIKTNNVLTGNFTYDSNGNRLTAQSPAIGTQTCTYDNQDRLVQCNGNNYGYTANGELQQKTVSGQTTTYQYDVLGNLLHVGMPDGTAIDYVIDGRQRRVGKKVNGTLVQGFLYSGQLRIVAELDGNNNLVSRFVYGTHVNVPDYMVKAGKTYRLITDHLGSPRLVVDTTTGAIVQRMDYDEWGSVTNDTNPGFQPFGFAGGLYDRDTKLVRFGARDYDAQVGRWTAKDPIRFDGGDTNLYGYIINDSINFIDTYGLYVFHREGEGYFFGREGVRFLEPGTGGMKFIEDYVPFMHDAAVIHDTIVFAGTEMGLPDWLVNVPTMFLAFQLAIVYGWRIPYNMHSPQYCNAIK